MRTVQDLTTEEVAEVNVRLNEYAAGPVFQAEVDTRMEVQMPALRALGLSKPSWDELVTKTLQDEMGKLMQEHWKVIVTEILGREQS